MTFFFLAGGYGRRARPLSLIRPKPVFPLNGIPLIRLMLGQLRNEGLKRGFINLHHLPDPIRENVDPDLNVTFFTEERLSGSMVLKRAIPFMEDELLVSNGDIFLEPPVGRLKGKLSEPGTDGVLLVRSNPGNYPSIRVQDDDFLGVDRTARVSPRGSLMYAGLAVLKKHVITGIEDPNFFASLAKNHWRIKVVVHDGIWLEVGDPLAYHRANFAYKRHVADPAENAVSPGVGIAGDSVVERSVIWEKTSICEHSVISDSIVTGNMVVRNGRFSHSIISRLGIFALPER